MNYVNPNQGTLQFCCLHWSWLRYQHKDKCGRQSEEF